MLHLFRRNCQGATAIEYGLMAGVLGVAILFAGGKIRDVIGAKLNELTFTSSTMKVENCEKGKSCQESARGSGAGGSATAQSSGIR